MTSDADPEQHFLRKFWASPTSAKLMCYDIALALLPTIVTALGAASMVPFIKSPDKTLWENLCFLLRDPYFVAVFVLYVAIAAMVIESHKHIASEEEDKTALAIAVYIIAPLLAVGFAQSFLEEMTLMALAVILLLSALVAYTSQHHLSIPLSYREKATKKPIPPEQHFLRKFWASPTSAKLMCYDIALALLPTIVTALGAASMVPFIKSPDKTLWENLCFLLRDPYFVAAFVLYVAIAAMVIESHKHIASEEEDKTALAIAVYIIAPLLAVGFAQSFLEEMTLMALAVILLLSALVAYTSQHHLSIPLSYRKKATKKPIPAEVHVVVVGLIVNLLLLVAVCIHIGFSDVPPESDPGHTENKDVTGDST